MAFNDPLWWKRSKWHRAGITPQVEAQEGRRLSHNVGTARHPRVAAKARRKTSGGGYRNRPSPLARALGYHPGGPRRDPEIQARLAAGYYDELRRQFEQADE